MVFCANCEFALVKKEKLSNTKYTTGHRVRCKHNHWGTDKGYKNIYTMSTVSPPNPHSCVDYSSMGDGIDSFMATLPDKVVWKQKWL